MSSVDGVSYAPSGTWQVSFDWLDQVPGSTTYTHFFSGPASTDGSGAHIVFAIPLGYLTFDAASNTFFGSVVTEDHESAAFGLQGWAPCNVGGNQPLSGSDARGDATCSWTFTPGQVHQCVVSCPPIADAGPDQTVHSGDRVTLSGSATDPDTPSSSLVYSWSPLSPDAPQLTGSTTLNPSFVAPFNIDRDTEYKYLFTVSDGTSSDSDEVVVTVRHLEIEISNDDQLNPYPINSKPPPPVAEIEIRAFFPTDDSPLRSAPIEVRACTEVGAANTDGHTHDRATGDPCFKSSRPHSNLNWYCCGGPFPQPKGNPITVITDNNGIAKVNYYPPQSSVLGTPYYISGQDKIVATLTSELSVKAEAVLRTMVPGLQPMHGSTNCLGGGTFVFQRGGQQNHGCLYYGTPFTNDHILSIANEYVQRQIDCANAAPHFNTEPACQIDNGPGSPGAPFVMIRGAALPMKITAMALPWGGLNDIGRNAGCTFDYDGNPATPKTECEEWKPPHQSHNDGKNVDIGFNGLQNNDPHIRLLRDVILDNGGQLPVPYEGGFLPQTRDHFHVRFNN
jgi:hypothetical protein